MNYAIPFLVALVAAAPLVAAEPTKTETRKVAATLYACQVAAKPREAGEFLLERSTGRSAYVAMGRALDPGCMKGEAYKYVEGLQGNLDLIRYGVATALVMREFRGTFPATLATAPALTHEPRRFDETAFRQSSRFRNLGPKALTQAKQEKAVYDFLERFGDCVVRRNPAAAQRFLTTTVASAEERAAFAAVRPALATCLPPGRQASLDLDLVRGTMAENFYRLAKVAPAVGAAR